MTDIQNVPVCPVTGAAMHREIRPMVLAYRQETINFDMPGWYCDASEESIHSSADMKVSDRMLNVLKARADHLLAPDEIRQIRKKLQLSQVQAGEIIGGGPRAFQKYEAGDLLPSKAISSALVLLNHRPEDLSILRDRQSSHNKSMPSALHTS